MEEHRFSLKQHGVVLLAPDLLPVAVVQERPERLVRIRLPDNSEHRNRRRRRREEATCASYPETPQVDRAGLGVLTEEQRGDQVPRDREKEADTQKAAFESAEAGMEGEDHEHRNPAQPVKGMDASAVHPHDGAVPAVLREAPSRMPPDTPP